MPDQSTLILAGGRVFDSEARLFRAADVVCRGGRIEELVADSGGVRGERIDCTGAFILPGLIDCHVHITSFGGPSELNELKALPTPERAWRAAEYARKTLHAGFTTVRDLGAIEHLNIHLANAIDAGRLEGPRILAAGMGVTMTGGHGHGFIAREADGPDEVRKGVREQLRAGAKTIKLFASGGVMTPGVDPRAPSFTEMEMAAGVEEAHKALRVVAAHAQATEGIKNAVRAGVDSIEHGVWLDDDAIELMGERGTFMVPTLTAPYHIAHGGLDAGIPAYMVEKAWQVLEDHVRSFRAAIRAGVNVAMGTDQGTPLNYAGANAQEILRMAEHGLSSGAAIMAATGWAADLLKRDRELGRIRPGLSADFVVVNRDPLAELAVLAEAEQFVAVVKAGAIVRCRQPGKRGGKR